MKQSYNLRALAYDGKGSIEIPVVGFSRWRDSSKISLEVQRKSGYGETPHWKFHIDTDNYADLEEGFDPIVAYRNKSEAIKSAAETMEELTHKIDAMEMIFQEGEAYRAEQARIKQEEEQAARDADTPVGKKVAKQIIEHMKKQAKDISRWSELTITAEDRGTRRQRVINVTHSRAGLLLFSERYSRISKATAIQIVADSNLSTLEVSGIGFADPTLYKFLMKK